jgi:hypothetical protein
MFIWGCVCNACFIDDGRLYEAVYIYIYIYITLFLFLIGWFDRMIWQRGGGA